MNLKRFNTKKEGKLVKGQSRLTLKQSFKKNPFQYVNLLILFFISVHFLFNAPAVAFIFILLFITGFMFERTPNSNMPLKIFFCIQLILIVIIFVVNMFLGK